MKHILLLEPSGAICINPNLAAIIRLLCDNSYHVDIITIKRQYQQDWQYPNSSIILCEQGDYSTNLNNYSKMKQKYDLVIGVDQAILSASFLAKKMKVPLGFISYEILFADEVGIEYKATEIEACKDVSFAVAQDRVRGFLVSREYQIPLEKLICIPVTDEYSGDTAKNDYLRKHFKLSPDKKIALFTGAVSNKSMIKELLGEVKNWGSDWVLVLHSHFGFTRSQIEGYGSCFDLSRVYFSDLVINDMDDLLKVIASADVGIGFFAPTFETKYECKNMWFIGLSSGKFGMYLKAGLPVIINEVGEMSDLVRKYDLGIVVTKNSDINPSHLAGNDFDEMGRRCKEVFHKYLCFDNYSQELLQAVNNSLMNTKIECNNGIDRKYLDENTSAINRQIDLFNKIMNTVNSAQYITGANLSSPVQMYRWSKRYAKKIMRKFMRRPDFIAQFNQNIIRHFSK